MSTFTPHNDLEVQLSAAQSGEISSDVFFEYLIGTQVFMPVTTPEADNINKVIPLTIETEDGNAYAVFSSPNRAKALLKQFPDYENGMLVDFKWLLTQAAPDLGLSLNPGLEMGIDMAPDMLKQFTP